MSINYVINDPLSDSLREPRVHTPRDDRPGSRAGFVYTGSTSERRYDVGSPEFLFWQCSEAALAAMETWERLDGTLRFWAGRRRNLELRQNAGRDLNAYYDRRTLSFFEFTTDGKTTYSGASTDVVAHEAGHACLDALRPDLWDSMFLEVAAFHEAFGDCMAILTALDDRRTRESLLRQSPFLWDENFVEATAEDLSDGIRRVLGPQHAAAEPRRALNWFNWQLPATLPFDGPPHLLTSEVHSFARVFTGCFYDLLANIFGAASRQTQASLRDAAHTAGSLLTAGARAAPDSARHFQAVGRAMVLADQQNNGGANGRSIHDAFAWHNVALGSAAMLAPSATLSGAAPMVQARRRGATLAASTRSDLRRRLGAVKGDALTVSRVVVGGQRVVQAVLEREVNLGDVDPRLKGVVAIASEPVLVGGSGRRAAVLGALPDEATTREEVKTFVHSLLHNGCIQFAGQHVQGARRRGAAMQDQCPQVPPPSHSVRKVGKRQVLRRTRTSCRF